MAHQRRLRPKPFTDQDCGCGHGCVLPHPHHAVPAPQHEHDAAAQITALQAELATTKNTLLGIIASRETHHRMAHPECVSPWSKAFPK